MGLRETRGEGEDTGRASIQPTCVSVSALQDKDPPSLHTGTFASKRYFTRSLTSEGLAMLSDFRHTSTGDNIHTGTGGSSHVSNAQRDRSRQ